MIAISITMAFCHGAMLTVITLVPPRPLLDELSQRNCMGKVLISWNWCYLLL